MDFYDPGMGEPQTLGQMMLSHHAPHEYDRCYKVGAHHLCSRCAGIYPALVAGLIALAYLLPAFPEWLEWLALLALPVPALLDWGASWVFRAAGTNWLRTLTGVLLGLSVSRNLHLQWTEPFQPMVLIQAGVVGGVALLIFTVGYIRRQNSVSTRDLIR